MIPPPKASEMEKAQGTARPHGDRVTDADAHAMGALLNRDTGSSELSSLFSSQTKQACTALKNRAVTDDLEQRLKRHQENKSLGKGAPGRDKEKDPHQGRDENGADDFAEELAQEVTEQILISDKTHMDPDSANEVRIKIKETILKDAHVHLVREPDCLQVRLISSDERSVHALVAARDRLEEQLQKNYKGLIRIKIVHLSAKGEV